MSKLINTGLQLQKALRNYVKGATQQKYTTINQIKEMMSSAVVDRLVAVGIYRIISNDRSNKLESIARLLDKKLVQYRPYPFQREKHDHFSISLHVHRLLTLLKYKLPVEETIQTIIEHILINQLTGSDLIILARLLEYQPIYYSKSYLKLVSHVFDLLQQHIQSITLTPSFIISVSFSLSHSLFRLPQALLASLNKGIDRILPHLDYSQITVLSHQMREKSLSQWIMAGNYQTQPFRKRVCFQYILNKQHPGLQQRNYLPGLQWKNATHLQQVISFVRSYGVNQAYIDIFPVVEQQYTNPLFGYSVLEQPQFINHYITYIFNHIKNGCKRIDTYSLFKIIRTLRSLFMNSPTSEPNAEYFQEFQGKHNINLINLMVVLYQLGRYKVDEQADLRKSTDQMLQIAIETTTYEYLRSFPYSQFKSKELITVFGFLSCFIVDAIALPSKANADFFKKVQIILTSHKEKKYLVNDYSKLLAFYRYAKLLMEGKKVGEGTQGDILLQEDLTLDQTRQLIQPFIELDTEQKQKFQPTLTSFFCNYKLIKRPLFQPNIQMQYAIINKSSKRVESVFEFSEFIEDRLSYIGQKLTIEGNVKVTDERKELTLSGLWKKTFFNANYKCDYLYSRSEAQLALKLYKQTKKLSNL